MRVTENSPATNHGLLGTSAAIGSRGWRKSGRRPAYGALIAMKSGMPPATRNICAMCIQGVNVMSNGVAVGESFSGPPDRGREILTVPAPFDQPASARQGMVLSQVLQAIRARIHRAITDAVLVPVMKANHRRGRGMQSILVG